MEHETLQHDPSMFNSPLYFVAFIAFAQTSTAVFVTHYSTIATSPVSTLYVNPTSCVPCLMKGDFLRIEISSLTLSSKLGVKVSMLCYELTIEMFETDEPVISPKLIDSICSFSEGEILSKFLRTSGS